MITKLKISRISNSWIISFIDLISLLIIFFLLIYSSNITLHKETLVTFIPTDNVLQANNIIDLDYLEIILKSKINNQDILYLQKKHQLIIRINKIILGQEEVISSQGKKIFEIIAFHLREISNKIEIKYKIAFITQDLPKFELLYPSFLYARKLYDVIAKQIDKEINLEFEISKKTSNEVFPEYLDIIINDY